MIHSRLQFALFAAFLTVSSCAPPRPTPYAPMGSGTYGYSDMSLGDSTYRVFFAGNPQTSLELVDRYALYRSAELTVRNGGNYFVILSDKADNTTTISSGGTSTADANVENNNQPTGSILPSTTTATATASTSYYSTSSTEHSSIKNIRCFTGSKPRDNPNAYDARAIVSTMEQQLTDDKNRSDQQAEKSTSGWMWFYVYSAIIVVGFLALYLATKS